MTNTDTIELLKETDKGIQMAIYSFDQVLERISDPALKKILTEYRNDHKRLKNETGDLLKAYGSYEEEPPAMAKGMAWMETNVKLGMEDSDRVIAEIVTKGCDMGTRNLYKYINQYAACDPVAVDTTKKLIQLENNLTDELRLYL